MYVRDIYINVSIYHSYTYITGMVDKEVACNFDKLIVFKTGICLVS